ncbi:MAG: glycosyltransferase [Victivallales bacterium]|nr:glycosyltransferase [Victivallales bacterium]
MTIPEPFFTVILAGYQCAPYLPASLASIMRQTCADFEAICYVEESTDDSLEICRQAAAQDVRFTVVSAPKSGSAACARNYAIDHAKGKYLVVIDGDDWIADDLLEALKAKIDQTGELDVVAFDAIETETDTADWNGAARLGNFTPSEANKVFSGWEAIRLARRHRIYYNYHVCINAYRVAFLMENHLRMTPGLRMEDYECLPRILAAARKMAYLDRALYVYRRHQGSVTTGGSAQTFFDSFRQFNMLIRFATEYEIPKDILAIWANQWLAFMQWILFHPKTSRRRTDADRRKALELLLADGNTCRLKKFARYASRPKRIAFAFVLLAAKGWLLPTKLFFRLLYYPLAERRH